MVGGFNRELFLTRRDLARAKRGFSDTEGYTVTFYGFGGVAQDALFHLCNAINNNNFIIPIKDIYLISQDKKTSEAKQLHNISHVEQILSTETNFEQTKIHEATINDLETILKKENQIFIFTAGNHDPTITNRAEILKRNLPLLEPLQDKFSEYKGLVNIVSNIPEVMAQYVAKNFKLYDPRQVTAHNILEVLRYNHFLRYQLFKDTNIGAVTSNVIGYHDWPYAVISTAKSLIEGELYLDGTSKKIQPGFSLKNKILNEYNYTEEKITEALRSYAPNEAAWQKMSFEDKKFISKGPTTQPTGFATVEFIKAVINRGYTTTAVPFTIDGKNYFVDLPVSLTKGYPEIDWLFLENLSPTDRNALYKRIVGVGRKPNYSLRQQIISVMGYDYDFDVNYDDTESLDYLFNKTNQPTQFPSFINFLGSSIDKQIINKLVERFTQFERDILPKKIRKFTEEMYKSQGKDFFKGNVLERKAMEKKEAEKRVHIAESLHFDAEIYIKDKRTPSLLKKITFDKSQSKGGIPVLFNRYSLSNIASNPSETALQTSKSKLFFFSKVGDKTLAMTYRAPKNKPIIIRSFLLTDNLDEVIISPKEISSGKQNYSILNTSVLDDTVYTLALKDDAKIIQEIDYKNNIIKDVLQVDNTAIGIAASDSHSLYVVHPYRTDLYNFKKLKKNYSRHSIKNVAVDFPFVSNDLLVTRGEKFLSWLFNDLKTNRVKEFTSTSLSFDVLESTKGISILRTNKEGLVIDTYKNKNDLMNTTGTTKLINHDLIATAKQISFIDDYNLLVSKLDELYILNHYDTPLPIRIENVKNFSEDQVMVITK